jgi:hypothetical protein
MDSPIKRAPLVLRMKNLPGEDRSMTLGHDDPRLSRVDLLPALERASIEISASGVWLHATLNVRLDEIETGLAGVVQSAGAAEAIKLLDSIPDSEITTAIASGGFATSPAASVRSHLRQRFTDAPL